MSESLPPSEPNPEVSPVNIEQLRAASLDLRQAMRNKVVHARSMHRKRLKLWAEKTKPANMTVNEYVSKLAQADHLPSDADLREALRRSHRVTAGTEIIDGHMIQHAYGVFEDEASAQLPDSHPETHLVITHIQKQSSRLRGLHSKSPDDEQPLSSEVALYTIDIVGRDISVNQGARQLDGGELALPFDIITQARALYV